MFDEDTVEEDKTYTILQKCDSLMLRCCWFKSCIDVWHALFCCLSVLAIVGRFHQIIMVIYPETHTLCTSYRPYAYTDEDAYVFILNLYASKAMWKCLQLHFRRKAQEFLKSVMSCGAYHITQSRVLEGHMLFTGRR